MYLYYINNVHNIERLEWLVRFSITLQTSHVHPQLDICTLGINQIFIEKQGTCIWPCFKSPNFELRKDFSSFTADEN